MSKRIAVYGGSFNPFACHHQDIIRWLVEESGYRHILVVPAVAHALKEGLLPYEHRYNMTRLGVDQLMYQAIPSLPFETTVVTSSIELDMLRQHPAPIRTYELLCEIRKGHPDAEIKFAIGPDIPGEMDRWANVNKIEAEFGFEHIPIQSMRATKLREMIASGVTAWHRYVPVPVRRYIEMHGLYRETEGTAS
jgi:nicotinic acid mononucleotide adenylyltransferase